MRLRFQVEWAKDSIEHGGGSQRWLLLVGSAQLYYHAGLLVYIVNKLTVIHFLDLKTLGLSTFLCFARITGPVAAFMSIISLQGFMPSAG